MDPTKQFNCSDKDARNKSKFCILMYHMISRSTDSKENRYACPPEHFDKHMKYLRSSGFNIVSLKDISNALRKNIPLPPKAVAVTLDDGFMDNYQNAFPILQEYEVLATIFLTSGMIGRTNLWLQKDGFPRRPMLNWPQIREMNTAGTIFGAHTVNHCRLPEMTKKEARNEIYECKKVIEDNLGKSVDYFAYPFGQSSKEIRNLVKEAGYLLACSTIAGFNNCDTDRYQLRRIEVYPTDSVWKLSLKLRFGIRDIRGLFSRIITSNFGRKSIVSK